jgi:serine-type D-Ala-D-Ala carboxypeptidase (penicillin-binding protein 5/6)
MRVFLVVLLASAMAFLPVGALRRADAADGPRKVRARSAYLYDMTSNRVLWGRDRNTRRPIGSITKAMTAYVVLQSGHLDRRIRIKSRHLSYAIARGASTAHLRPGDRLTARELLYALLLPSGSDAAVALAEAYGPGRRTFVRKMNKVARGLGMTRTHYANFDGLPYPGPYSGYSTAKDLVTFGRHALEDPTFRTIVGQRRHVLRATREHRRYIWRTTNELLGDYPGMLGIKSGHTSAAGYCLLFAARRYGRTLVGAVLNSSQRNPSTRFDDAVRLLNWGFAR